MDEHDRRRIGAEVTVTATAADVRVPPALSRATAAASTPAAMLSTRR
jgi:hypothetical protein